MLSFKSYSTGVMLFSIVALCSLISFSLSAQTNSAQSNTKGGYGVRVNTYNGNLLYQRSDLNLPAIGQNIDFTFTYNSRCTGKDFGYGRGWTMSYNMQYTTNGSGDITIEYHDGKAKTFTNSGSGFNAPLGTFELLEEYAIGKFVLTSVNQIKYYFDDGSHKKLTSIVDLNGNTTTLSYSLAGELIQINSSCGTAIDLIWTNGYLTSINDNGTLPARSYQYDYTGDLLTKYTDPAGNTELYTYNDRNLLAQLTNKNGHAVTIDYATPSNAVINLTTPLSTQTYQYNDMTLTTTLSEQVGANIQNTTFQYNTSGQLMQKIGSCCGYNIQYVYDTNNNLVQRIDAAGNSTTYTYNLHGQKLTETDALGNMKSYTYDPLSHRKLSETDKNGNTTSYTYDANGNLIQINYPLGFNESYTYTLDGNVASFTDKNGNTTSYTYDACGQLITINRPLGSSTFFSYSKGLKISETDANNCTTTYAYDVLNRMISQTDDLGYITSYTYDAVGNRISLTDPNGNITSYTYDALNRLLTIAYPLGISEARTYNQKNRVSLTDPNGGITNYTYNSQNLLEQTINPEGGVTSYVYDARGNRTGVTDPNGNTFTYSFDVLSRLIQYIDPLGGITQYTYDAHGNRTSMTDPLGNTTTTIFDALHRPIQIIDPLGGITSTQYDGIGNEVSVTDANANTILYAYDALNRGTSKTDALGIVTTYTYDNENNIIAMKDGENQTVIHTYDCNNNLLSTTNPDGNGASFVYDGNRNLIQSTQMNNNTIQMTYDALNRKIQEQDNQGVLVQYTYDNKGNVLSKTDPNGNTTQYTYNGIDQKISEIDPLGETMLFSYDDNSNLLSTTDREGHVMNMQYDALNRKVSQTDHLGNTTTFTRDANGNTTAIIDANGNTTQYVFDANSRNTTEQFEDGTTKNYTYDAVGNMISRTDNKGETINYQYDDGDRLITIDYPDSNDDTYTYNNLNKLVSATNGNAIINFTYNADSRLLSEELNGYVTAYAYDLNNRTRTISYPNGRSIQENFDYRYQMTSIQEGGTTLASFTYDAGGRITQKSYANGVTSTFSFNANDNPLSILHNNGNPFVHLQYSYDKEDNKLSATALHQSDQSEQYEYDFNHRLINYKKGVIASNNIPSPNQQEEFTIDPLYNKVAQIVNGNTTTYSANEMNEITQMNNGSSTSLFHDANGNLTYDGFFHYSYDYANRLIVAAEDANLEQMVAHYKYDALGRRIQKIAEGKITNYYYQGMRIILEEVLNPNCPYYLSLYERETGQVKLYQARDFVTSTATIDSNSDVTYQAGDSIVLASGFCVELGSEFLAEIQACDPNTDTPEQISYVYGTSIDDVISMNSSTCTHYFHKNALGSVIALTDDVGSITERYEYSPYGEVKIYDANYNERSSSECNNPYRYTGRRFDKETTTYYYRARQYHPRLGRFLQRDPFDYTDAMNLYQYAKSNPIKYLDPYGFGSAIYPFNSRISNQSSDQCLIAWNGDTGYEVLNPGDSTSAWKDRGDYGYYNNHWHKVPGGHHKGIDDRDLDEYDKDGDGTPDSAVPPGEWTPGPPPEDVCRKYCDCIHKSSKSDQFDDFKNCGGQDPVECCVQKCLAGGANGGGGGGGA